MFLVDEWYARRDDSDKNKYNFFKFYNTKSYHLEKMNKLLITIHIWLFLVYYL